MYIKKILISLIGILTISIPSLSAPLHISAELDSTVMLMGHQTLLNVSINQAKGEKGHLPILNLINETGIVGLCGDSVELRAPIKVDTIETDGRLKIDYQLPVQSFDSGFYRLPSIAFAVGHDTVYSKPLMLKVVPVLVDANTPISDYANVSDPENKSIFDIIPDWVLNYWWVILIVILVIVASILAWIKYRKDGYIIPKKPQPTPYELAIMRLQDLKAKKLWESGMEKEYYTDLTDILRIYMYGRFGINAMEMTSRQILGVMKNSKELRGERDYIRQILNMADFVKFAKVRPLPDDCIASYENAFKFLEDTKPQPVEEEATQSSKSKSNKKISKKGGKK